MVPGTIHTSVAGPVAVGVEGQDLGAVVGDQQGVLELGGAAAVGGAHARVPAESWGLAVGSAVGRQVE